MDKRVVDARVKSLDEKMMNRIKSCLSNPKNCANNTKKLFNFKSEKRSNLVIYTGKILHLDGDKKYSEKSIRYYKSLGLNAIVKKYPKKNRNNLSSSSRRTLYARNNRSFTKNRPTHIRKINSRFL